MSNREPQIRNQLYLFSESLNNKIEKDPHEARFFLFLANKINLGLYKISNTGTPPYQRRTLIAIILLAMCKGFYEARQIIRFATDSIGASWILNGMNMPSYKTVERIMNSLLEEVDSFFTQILDICKMLNLIGEKRAFTDGTKIKANASKHKAMSYEYLKKKINSNTIKLDELFSELKYTIDYFEGMSDEEIDNLINQESLKVHNKLLKMHQEELNKKEEETFNIDSKKDCDSATELDKDKLNQVSDILNNTSEEKYDEILGKLNDVAYINKRLNVMEFAKIELETKWEKENGDKKIPDKQQINFTDSDSCIMTTKHQGVQQCYNHLGIVDDKANIILGTYTSNNSSDQVGLIPTIEKIEQLYGSLNGFQLGADAGFFSAANIRYAQSCGIDFYASFPEFSNPYSKEKFKYNKYTDTYTCPKGNILSMCSSSNDEINCKYSNKEACLNCKNNDKCTKSKDKIRVIERNKIDDKLREEAKEKAITDEGKKVLKARKGVIETVWGNIKTQDGLTQMHYRGIDKATLEFRLHCAMHNIRKILKVYFKTNSYQQTIHNAA
jgi:transposase